MLRHAMLMSIAASLLANCGQNSHDQDAKNIPIAVKQSVEIPPLLDGAKMVRCEIKPNRYSGPCMFLAGDSGSFSVQMRDRSPLYPDVNVVSVSITEPGKAQVFGLTTFGNNSRWGEAVRSQEEPACWVGVDFEVCAY